MNECFNYHLNYLTENTVFYRGRDGSKETAGEQKRDCVVWGGTGAALSEGIEKENK